MNLRTPALFIGGGFGLPASGACLFTIDTGTQHKAVCTILDRVSYVNESTFSSLWVAGARLGLPDVVQGVPSGGQANCLQLNRSTCTIYYRW